MTALQGSSALTDIRECRVSKKVDTVPLEALEKASWGRGWVWNSDLLKPQSCRLTRDAGCDLPSEHQVFHFRIEMITVLTVWNCEEGGICADWSISGCSYYLHLKHKWEVGGRAPQAARPRAKTQGPESLVESRASALEVAARSVREDKEQGGGWANLGHSVWDRGSWSLFPWPGQFG